MTDETWDTETTKTTEQERSGPEPARLGIGRGKARPETNTDAPPPVVSQWNGGGSSGTSGGFKSFGNNNNDENNNPGGNSGLDTRSSGGFNTRGGRDGFGGNRGGFGSNNDRACYNCNQTGHISRDCPEARNENSRGGRGGRGGYNSGGGSRGGFNMGGNRGEFNSSGGFNSGNTDRQINFGSRTNGDNLSMSITVRNSGNQNDDDQGNNGDRRGGFGSRRDDASNGNGGDNFNERSTFNNSASRGSFNNDGFRGSRGGSGGGFNSGDRGGRFNSGDRGGGFNSGDRGGGFNSGDRGGGFNSGDRGGGFNSGDRGGGFNSGDRGGGFNSGDRGGRFNSGDRGGGFNSGDRGGGFNSGDRGGGFNSGDRGGGFNSGDRGGGFNSSNRGRDNQSHDFSGDRRPPGDDGNAFVGGGRNDRKSDNIFDQLEGHGGAQPIERYIPPPPPTTENDIFGEAVAKGENFGKYHRTTVKCTPDDKVKSIELYEEANLGTQVLSNIRRAHFEEPTPIQRYTIPCIQQQDDIMACAQTGSGKTAAFLLPIISNLLQYHADELTEKLHPPSPLCLILSPTRELALQTEREARKFSYQTAVVPCSAVGGHDMFTVSDRLREGCHILSATTGRLKDMVEKGRVSLKKVKYFVLDEADRMLDTGFEPDIRKLEDLGMPPKDERFTSMFSATFPNEVQQLAKHFLRDNYIFLVVGTPGGANEDIAQTIEEVPQSNKKDRLFQLLEENLKSQRCLIFVETKRSADYIGALLSQKNLMSTTMHGDRTQKQRSEAVQQFTNGKCPILVATSVAARGLDFPLIGYVVNYDLPDSSDFYIHRIGRTGRAGHLGKSISFFDPSRDSDQKIAPDLVAKLVEAGQEVPDFLSKFVDGTNTGFTSGGPGSRNADMRSGANTFGARYQQSAAPSGGSASAGAAAAEDNWD